MSTALANVVVLDLTTEFWSALGTAMLGDFGARVVRVEKLREARERRSTGNGSHPSATWNCPSKKPRRCPNPLTFRATLA